MSGSTALRLPGRDALALLHRISTNQLGDLAPGRARATLFCDFRGRLLHRALVGVAADGSVWLFRDDAPGAELAAFLDRHVFRDDVRIEDRSDALRVWRRAAAAPEIARGALIEREGVPVAARGEDDEGLEMGAPAPAGDDVAAGRARVRAGLPAHGHEIAEAFTPFEVGLAHEVHLDKGCFTGQEALMRLVTYRSVRRRLARVSGAGQPPTPPRELRAGGASAGVLTSAVADGGGWIGLAVLRNEICDAPRALEVEGGGTTGLPERLAQRRPQGRP